MKFRYYITSIFSGDITGTNDKDLAENIAMSEDDFVLDSETGEWILSDNSRNDVEETILAKDDNGG